MSTVALVGGVPGVGYDGRAGRAIPVPGPAVLQDPYLTIFSYKAYLRPNEGYFRLMMRFPRIGSRKGPRMTSELT